MQSSLLELLRCSQVYVKPADCTSAAKILSFLPKAQKLTSLRSVQTTPRFLTAESTEFLYAAPVMSEVINIEH